MNITVTTHAIDRAKERFNLSHSSAEKWIRENFRKATFIGTVANDKDATKNNRIFSFKRIVFVVDEISDVIVTLFEQVNRVNSVHHRVTSMVKREIAKLERKEQAIIRKSRLERAQLNVEIAQLQLKKERARSEATKLACDARINAINEYLATLDAQVIEIKNQKKTMVRTMALYV